MRGKSFTVSRMWWMTTASRLLAAARFPQTLLENRGAHGVLVDDQDFQRTMSHKAALRANRMEVPPMQEVCSPVRASQRAEPEAAVHYNERNGTRVPPKWAARQPVAVCKRRSSSV